MTSSVDQSSVSEQARQAAQEFRASYERIQQQVCRAMVGQADVVEGVLTAMVAGGHVLLEGVPGLGKTMLVRTLGNALDLPFSRIQFTPDMMPADIQGTNVLVENEGGGHELQFEEGPLVSSLVLADEINRATPKTQSALLEAMQERQISVGRRTIHLQEPFCVMATQNPVEQEGTYPLPEAQLDRFLMKVQVGYPEEHEYLEILNRTTGTSEVVIEAVSDGAEIMRMREVVRAVAVAESVSKHAVKLVMATQPGREMSTALVNENVALGSSPRGAQALILCAKVKALLAGRFAVSTDDIRAVANAVLRHRVMINFHGIADGITADQIVADVLHNVQPVPAHS
jgi:MoxR-like ATPase